MRSIERGSRNAERETDRRTCVPRSAFRVPRLPVGGLMLALLPSLAGAQQPDSLPSDTLAPVVVTGVRLPTTRELARGLAGRTATLHAADLDARGVRSLADALEQLPGVTTSDELGAPGQLDVTLRGFQVSPTIGLPQGVTVYLDGVRVNEPDAHEVNFDLLPLEDVDHVDVTYGPSVLLGRNSLGAAVNLVTRRGSVPAERELEASGGSFGRYELKARAGGRRGMWDYYAPQAHLVTLNAHRVLGGMQLALNGFGRALTTDQFNRNASPPDTRERNRERIGGGAVQVSGTVTLAGRPLRWLAGVDGAYQHTAVRLYAARPTRPDSLTESVLTNEVDG